ncbi:siderophore-interacting protein [Streptomyces sp. NPDC090106]|uniref:siderophore-interacting protein n=1 Tax=Streptomyces sp. NPDC090106 TaxID=3365946 RepID=UPI003807D5F0
MAQGHGWEGAVLRLLRARDYVLEVTRAEDVTPHYRRLHLTDGGMLAETGVHPTMWVRLWIPSAGKPHQRAYTLVDADPSTGTFSLEFALHEGAASDWARAARPGDTIEATVHGTGFEHPDPTPSRLFAIGDPASLPAVNSLLAALPDTPATIWFEGSAAGLPLRTHPSRHEVRATDDLVTDVKRDLPDLLAAHPDAYVWITCDTRTTRTLSSYVRKDLGLAKERVHAMGYWRA